MNHNDWNYQPWYGAVTAEDFMAQTAAHCPNCGGHGCQEQDHTPDYTTPPTHIVCCQAFTPSRHKPIEVKEGCCCKESFRAALQLLCNSQLSSLLDFNQTAFITDSYVAGSTLHGVPSKCNSQDNLSNLTGCFRGFSPCNCDLLDISAPVYAAPDTFTGVTATQTSLCQLTAVVLQAASPNSQCSTHCEEDPCANFQRILHLLSQHLTPCTCQCPTCSCPCPSHDCCCDTALLQALCQNNFSRKVTLVAGSLALQDATLLGTVGNVLVLSNETNQRIYFVCVNSIQFLG